MTNYSKLNIVYKLQKWMDSVPGQTFLNYAYSWGASIVILGTLFKLTHLPGANFFLYLGMGTEVFVFFISAFDRPFDKTTDGMDLDIHADMDAEPAHIEGGGTIVINGGGSMSGGAAIPQGEAQTHGAVAFGGGTIGGGTSATPSVEVVEATGGYIDELNNLTEVLRKVKEQSERLTADSEEMENLNRTLTGISRVYEMQLKSASSQMGTIDEINEQTRHMARQIAELNAIYARMIEAMSVQNINRQ